MQNELKEKKYLYFHDYMITFLLWDPLWRVVNAGNIYDNQKIFFSNYLIMLIMLIIDECSINLNIRLQ